MHEFGIISMSVIQLKVGSKTQIIISIYIYTYKNFLYYIEKLLYLCLLYVY